MGADHSTHSNILAIGNFGNSNFGDDVLHRVLNKYLTNVTFCNVELCTKEMTTDANLIVIAGDTLTVNFMKRLMQIVYPHKTCPIYAIGVSVSNSAIVDSGALDIVDRFWCRFDTDVKLLQGRFPKWVHAIPEMSLAFKSPEWLPRPRNIGICLARPMVRDNEAILVRQVAKWIQHLYSLGWKINWIAFNDGDAEESDVEFFDMLPESARRYVTLYRGRNLLTVMSWQSVIVASRFSATVFAHKIGIPVVSLEFTKKIHEWNVARVYPGIALERCDNTPFQGMVKTLPIDAIMTAINNSVAPISNFSSDHVRVGYILGEIAESDWASRPGPPYALDRDRIRATAVDVYFRFLRKEFTREEICRILCLLVTGDTEHRFYSKLILIISSFEFDLIFAITYMMREHSVAPQWHRSLQTQSDGLFSLAKTWQFRLDGAHRSGWATVLDSMSELHSERGPVMDAFLDRTFGWHSRELEAVGAIPYREPWMGFLHHPPHAAKGENDCAHVIDKKSFRDSLAECVALFVMSSNLRDWLRVQAQREGLDLLNKIPIHVVMHPTDIPFVQFTWNRYVNNIAPSLVHIGAWCRDSGSIFRIATRMSRAALITPDMTEYVRINSDVDRIDKSEPFLTGEQVAEVRMIPRLGNAEYDELLSQNIVFLPLKTAVACNTLLECISRHTPVLVPRLPSVVEYIGGDYPLLYEDEAHAERLIASRDSIEQAYEYLRTMNIERFSHHRFIMNIRARLAPPEREGGFGCASVQN